MGRFVGCWDTGDLGRVRVLWCAPVRDNPNAPFKVVGWCYLLGSRWGVRAWCVPVLRNCTPWWWRNPV